MENKPYYDINEIAASFREDGEFLSAVPYGEGHINDTYAAYFRKPDGREYRTIVQRINHSVFTDPQALMNNIQGVTNFLKKKIAARGGDVDRETLTVIPTTDNQAFYRDSSGNYWRNYIFVENATSYQACENDQDFYNCGKSFGNFQLLLADYPVETLVETIPNFHNTVKRFEALEQAIQEDKAGRLKEVQTEVAFAMMRKEDAGELIRMLDQGELPLRVTHNDTKLNNILIDDETGEGICVIDLDTVMPGLACYDFGDSIRFGASTAAEDETDLSKVEMSLHLFEVFADGYLSVAKHFLTPQEAYSLAVGSKIMTFECGCRFLTDYLNGDVYFKTHYPQQNLDRCRTQYKLVADMEKKMDEMHAIVQKYYR